MSRQLIRLFDAEMRADPPAEPGQRIERVGGLVRTCGLYNMIVHCAIDAAHAETVVAEQAAYFRQRGEEIEWKLYSHDEPANLSSMLAAHGFERGDAETLMALPLRAEMGDTERPADVSIVAVASQRDLATYVEVATSAFGSPPTWSAQKFERRLFGADADTLAFIAYVGAELAAVGRLELPHARSFASMWGGGTAPHLRKRGVYRALVRHRVRIARKRGYAYLTVDALETSRPILERLGFSPQATVHAWVLQPVARRTTA